jgi:hypothetical protein
MTELESKVLANVQAQVSHIIEDNWRDIIAARNEAAIAFAKENETGKFKFKVNVAFVQEPRGLECKVGVALSYSIPHADARAPEMVSAAPELPLGVTVTVTK